MNAEELEYRPEYLPLRVPKIHPIRGEAPRPFWSVMVPTYNRPEYLQQTLRSILQQDPGRERMQIEVVDNCSTVGDMEATVKQVAGDRVGFFRQSRNVGHFLNGITCLQRSRGNWIHILHDDDLVLPGFYSKYERLIDTYPDATLLMGPSIHVDKDLNRLHSSMVLADAEGPVPDFAARQAVWNQVSTPTAVVPRRVYEELGGYPKGLGWSSDWEMWFRAGTAGRTITTTQPYALYRMHGGADSVEKISSETNIAESIRMIHRLCKRLTPEQRRLVPRNPYRRLADAACYYSDLVYKAGNLRASMRQLRWSARLRPRPTVYLRLAQRAVAIAVHRLIARRPASRTTPLETQLHSAPTRNSL